MKLKKFLALTAAVVMTMSMAAGCGNSDANAGDNGSDSSSSFDATSSITVVSREDGSGTRGAFVELIGVEDEDGNDITTEDAVINNSTNVMMTTVAGDEYAIGYVSLGSLNDTVKALKVDGAEATAENILNGSYKVSRPFNIATKGDMSDVTKDFISFIMSDEGQAIVEEEGYIPSESKGAYAGTEVEGKVVVAGSSSVSPVMEKIIEAYKAVNTKAEIELQTNDSSTGMSMATEGTCDIGMASRELKDSELEAGLQPIVMATDGIAIVVNNANTLEDITAEQIKSIYVGEVFTWDEIIG